MSRYLMRATCQPRTIPEKTKTDGRKAIFADMLTDSCDCLSATFLQVSVYQLLTDHSYKSS
jgi:hypothetical protein